MLAVQAIRFGGPDVLVAHQVPDPAPGPGEVVVAVAAVDVLFVDTQIRAGWGQQYFPMRPPYVPGDGVAGEVVAVGDGVDVGWLGRRVLGYTDNKGGYAERVAIDADWLAALPDELSFTDAAAIAHDGPMAYVLTELAQVRRGSRVLLLGANGGAGVLAVQLLSAAGAEVIGTARGESKQELVRSAGAAAVVDPSDPGWLVAVGTVDVVLDGVGGELGTAAFAAVADGGRFFGYGAPTGNFSTVDAAEANRRDVTVLGLEQFARARARMVEYAGRALAALAAGDLTVHIGATFPLASAAAAHAALESRAVLGKVVLVG